MRELTIRETFQVSVLMAGITKELVIGHQCRTDLRETLSLVVANNLFELMRKPLEVLGFDLYLGQNAIHGELFYVKPIKDIGTPNTKVTVQLDNFKFTPTSVQLSKVCLAGHKPAVNFTLHANGTPNWDTLIN